MRFAVLQICKRKYSFYFSPFLKVIRKEHLSCIYTQFNVCSILFLALIRERVQRKISFSSEGEFSVIRQCLATLKFNGN